MRTAMGVSLPKDWQDWKVIGEPIGKGTFGIVYRAEKKIYGDIRCESAVKIVNIPKSPEEFDEAVKCIGRDAAVRGFRNVADEYIEKLLFFLELSGHSTIISGEDAAVEEQADHRGWTVFIRMELAEALASYLKKRGTTEKTVIQIGCDICEALEVCEMNSLVHLDIKPDNLYFGKNGRFKLGDFGTVFTFDDGKFCAPRGTRGFMAPEVCRGKQPDQRADIYSLGIVLYYLLNCYKLPFVHSAGDAAADGERLRAEERRLSGEKLPRPENGSEWLTGIVMKACSFRCEDRYRSAEEFHLALTRAGKNREKFPHKKLWSEKFRLH